MPRQNKILIRQGTTVPSAGDFDTAEPAWDATSGKFYIKDAAGSMVQVGNDGTVTSVSTGTGLTGGPITTSGTISLANTTVSAGSYTAANITVDAQGRITAASSGTSGGTDIDGLSDGTTQFTENVGLGSGTLNSLASGSQENTGLGYNAGQAITTTNYNTLIGSRAGRYSSGTANTAVGRNALLGVSGSSGGSYNTAIGSDALQARTTGTNNTALGFYAGGSLTTGGSNIHVGYAAGYANTTAGRQICIGYFAGQNSNGYNIIGIGEYALRSAGSTTQNKIAIGNSAARSVTTGQYLIAIGNNAGYNITTGLRNTVVGHTAGNQVTTGSDNVAVGDNSLSNSNTSYCTAVGSGALSNSSGPQNTALGYNAGSTITSGANNICIGQDAQPSSTTVSNEITLGNTSITTLRCNTQTISSLSDGRDKTEVEDLPLGLDFIDTLRPVKFKWDTRDGNSKDGTHDAGFIAQDLQYAQSASDAEYLNMVMDENPDRLEARYGQLIPVLVQAIKDLKIEIDALKSNA